MTLLPRPAPINDHEVAMSRACPRPCPFVHRHRHDLIRLRDHLAEGHRCADAWVALAHLVREPWQRLDCLERASAIDPNDQNLRIAHLEHHVVLHPEDTQAAEELREAKARRALERYKPRIFRHQDASQPIGVILRALHAVNDADLEVALEEQERLRRLGRPMLLGDLLVLRGKTAPEALARALTLQSRLRAANGAMPRTLSEYLMAKGHVTPDQLERALIEQIRLHTSGKHEPLGEILLRQGAVDTTILQRAFQQHMHDAMTAFV
ncbi:hypothetical protein [Roseiflexus sp.]|uniref:hypothetical protein n=1 Tax=Roseiflexus sp. TaxID=2562120 RepID=UPI00258E6B20|nr:hypothetical protein [Roseiflexus sp.]